MTMKWEILYFFIGNFRFEIKSTPLLYLNVKSYIEAIENLPEEFRWALIKAFEIFREEIADTVRRSDFNELKAVVEELAEAQKQTEQKIAELAEAQRRTEQRVEELAEAQKQTEQRIAELAEAQRRTEQRLTKLEQAVAELAEAQKQTEQRIAELAEAQRRTEQRLTKLEQAVAELAEAQKQTEQKIAELAEAQRKTEKAIQRLTKEQDNIKEYLGALSHTVGYRLEDEAMKAIPRLLKEDFGVEVVGKLIRDFLEIGKNKYVEVNLFGEAKKDGKDYLILGEAKSQLKKKSIDEFIKKSELIKRYIPKEQILLYVTYIAHPMLRKYAEEKGIKIYFSYEL